AATLVNAGVAGLNQGISFTPRGSTTTTPGGGANNSGNVTLSRLGSLSSADFTTSLPGALLKAIVNDSTTRVLTNPQVRASDGQKVTLNIGDRVPVASGSFQTGVGGSAAGVNTQFQYINVGVNVDITPQIHSANEVTLQVDLEVSSIKDTVTVGNSSNPVIGQDKATANLRLREGEINILAGLSTLQNSEGTNGIPGLVNIPVLGKILFGTNHVEKDKGELMIALIPHIVRTPDYSAESLRGVYAGLEQRIKLLKTPKFEKDPNAPTGGAGIATPGTLAPTAPATPGQPAATPQATAPQATTTPPQSTQAGILLPTVLPPGVPGGPPAAPGAPPANGPRVAFLPGTINAARNAPFTVEVRVENAVGATGLAPLRISWDPAVLRLNDISPGDLLSRDGQRVTSVKDVRNDLGQASLTINRPAGATGVSGSGSAASLTFVAIGAGSGRVTVTEMGLTDATNRPVSVSLGSLPVAVQ
ncbi:MAG: cohesin domain-containing protein, partial [Acidobacteriota bacterium]